MPDNRMDCARRSLAQQLTSCFQCGTVEDGDDDKYPRSPHVVVPRKKQRKSRIKMEIIMLLQGKLQLFHLII